MVNASSEKGRLAVNGMSYSGRNSSASNSAIVVQINTSDFPDADVLSGMRLQRDLEEKAYKVSSGAIPVQYLKDFAKDKSISKDYFSENEPECKGKWEFADLHSFLPEYISGSIISAFPEFGTKMKGFDSGNTLLLGLESRTSSPVRILRV